MPIPNTIKCIIEKFFKKREIKKLTIININKFHEIIQFKILKDIRERGC